MIASDRDTLAGWHADLDRYAAERQAEDETTRAVLLGDPPAFVTDQFAGDDLARVVELARARGRWPASPAAANRWARPGAVGRYAVAAEHARQARGYLARGVADGRVVPPIPQPAAPRPRARWSLALVPPRR